MLAGFSGHLISEFFLEQCLERSPLDATEIRRQLAKWRRASAHLGPASSPRALLESGAAPLLAALGARADGAVALLKTAAAATIVLPDGRRVAATITEAWTVIEAGQGNGSPTTKVEAVLTPTDESTIAGLGQLSVDAVFTRAERKDVLTVPVAALVVLREGGYGVEVIDGETGHYVAVKTGLFADGRVEVTGSGIAEGTTVGMPA